MNKLSIEDIKPESLLTHLNILSSEEGTAYEIRGCFTLKTGEVVRVTFTRNQMDFCVRKPTGDYLCHLIYEFAPGIINRYLNKLFSAYIKDVLNKEKFDNTSIINVINKVRKNYIDCTPVLKL